VSAADERRVTFTEYALLDADTRKPVLSMRATSVDVVRAAVIRGDVTRAMAPSGYVVVRDMAAGQAVAFLAVTA
jgi:hypothetical protein